MSLRVAVFMLQCDLTWPGEERPIGPMPRSEFESGDETWLSRLSAKLLPVQMLIATVHLDLGGRWPMYADECPFTRRRKWRAARWRRSSVQGCNPSATWRYGPLWVHAIWERTGVEERS